MLRLGLKMLLGDRVKYTGLVFGIAFTAFLVTFAASFFCAIMTRAFALVAENPAADVWVMDPAVEGVDQMINMPTNSLDRVRSVEGVEYAVPLALASTDMHFPSGRFQAVQVIGVDDVTLAGAPPIKDAATQDALRAPDAAIIDPGGTIGKLETPRLEADRWPSRKPDLDAATRPLAEGDVILVNDHRVRVAGRSESLPRFPPRPILYMTYSNALRVLPPERRRLTLVLATAVPGGDPRELAERIEAHTGLRARASDDFKADTVRWFLVNSEDVGDVAAMLLIAMLIGFGVTGVMLYMFTNENLKQYAVLSAMGASSRVLLAIVFVQAGFCGLLGTGMGVGLCAVVGRLAVMVGKPFRMMWFTPLVGGAAIVLVCTVAAAISVRPVLRQEPSVVFAARR